ncbi:MAG: hypothetical protein KAY02_05020 [Acidovorax sp.]|jgi:hypothetical protein|nr:hypothetical protein [Acidovorax sp.]
MRRIAPRPALPPDIQAWLDGKGADIAAAQDPKSAAERLYKLARGHANFEPVLDTLRSMSGLGWRCMYCSGSEGHQVEHWRPKSRFSLDTFTWVNLLWVCGQCNQAKGERFEEACPPLDPVREDIWKHCYIDEFGQLNPVWNTALDRLDPRGEATINLLELNREALQEARHARLQSLRKRARHALTERENGTLSDTALVLELLDWFTEPVQPDVADYFLDGPGAQDTSEPFVDLLARL